MELHVWLAFYLHADQCGLAWPSLDTLSRETGYHEDNISAAKKYLVTAGWMEPMGKQKRKIHGMFGSRVYHVNIPDEP